MYMLSRIKRMLGLGSKEVAPPPAPEVSRAMEALEKRWLEEKEIQHANPVNEGEPPTAALKIDEDEKGNSVVVKENGKEVRGRVSEDAKINDSENGLLLVADGVSGPSIDGPDGKKQKPFTGVIASTIMAEVAQAYLGDQLTTYIDQLKAESVPNKSENIDAVVIREMARTIFRANKEILDTVEDRKKDDLKQDITGAATTATLSRRVVMPDGKERLYYTNVGDSRGYVMRKGKLIKLTTDDSFASFKLRYDMKVDDPAITAEERAQREKQYEETLNQIEQADGARALPEVLRPYFKIRNVITRAVGRLNDGEKRLSNEDFLKDLEGRVRYIDLEEGDEIVHVSDGVSDNLTQAQIEAVLFDTTASAKKKSVEQRLQEAAEDVIRDVNNPRSKPDDVAAACQKVGARQPQKVTPEQTSTPEDEGELLDPSEVEEVEEQGGPSAEEVAEWNKANQLLLDVLDESAKKIKELRKRLTALEKQQYSDLLNNRKNDGSLNAEYRRLKDEEQGLLDQQLEIRAQQAPYKRWFAAARLQELQASLSKPLEPKMEVRLPERYKNERLDDSLVGGSVDILSGWTNGGYDEQTNQYLVSRGAINRWVPRVELDLAQAYAKNPLLTLKAGDVIRDGKNAGWKVKEVAETSLVLFNPKNEDEYRMISVDRSSVQPLEEIVFLEQEMKEADLAEKQLKQMQ